jgi:hypothetical protein
MRFARSASGGRATTTGANTPARLTSATTETAADLVAAVVDVLATDAPQLVPPYVRGLQYLAPPTMIQTALIPLHPAAVGAYTGCMAERKIALAPAASAAAGRALSSVNL